MIIEYKRKGRKRTKSGKMGNANARQRKGIMVAFPDEEKKVINFGFSLCCFRQKEKSVDDFDIEFGTKLAVERALSTDRSLCIPCSMAKDFRRFVAKCIRYYKRQMQEEGYSNSREIVYRAQEVPTPT